MCRLSVVEAVGLYVKIVNILRTHHQQWEAFEANAEEMNESLVFFFTVL